MPDFEEEVVDTIKKYIDGEMTIQDLDDWVAKNMWDAPAQTGQESLLDTLMFEIFYVYDNRTTESDMKANLFVALQEYRLT